MEMLNHQCLRPSLKNFFGAWKGGDLANRFWKAILAARGRMEVGKVEREGGNRKKKKTRRKNARSEGGTRTRTE